MASNGQRSEDQSAERVPVTPAWLHHRPPLVIRTDERGPVTVVTIDRPERRNAVDLQALRGFDLGPDLDGAAARRDVCGDVA